MIEITCDCGSRYVYGNIKPPETLTCGCGTVLIHKKKPFKWQVCPRCDLEDHPDRKNCARCGYKFDEKT